MTPNELARMCADAINAQHDGTPHNKAEIAIVTPRGWTPPSGFPRGHVIAVKDSGERVRYVGAARVLSWMLSTGIAEPSPRVVRRNPGETIGQALDRAEREQAEESRS